MSLDGTSDRLEGTPPATIVSLLDRLAFYHLSSVPRYEPEEDGRSLLRSQLYAGLINAHVRGSVVGVVWSRLASGEPLSVYVAHGARTDQNRFDAEVALLYPPGSRGSRILDGEMRRKLGGFTNWLRCRGIAGTLKTESNDSASTQIRGPFEDYVAYLARQPFAWVVVGEPLPPDRLQAELDSLETAIRRSKGRESAWDRLEIERAEKRFRELSSSRTSGAWSVHVLVGAPADDDARQIASLLCSASDIAPFSYLILPDENPASLDTALAARFSDPSRGASPFVATAELFTALARPPERELPGIRLVTPHTFDVTPEVSEGVQLGTILDANLAEVGVLRVSYDTLNRHTFVSGATGSGKSQTVRWLLEQLARKPGPNMSGVAIPWLVIEPAKAEYARMAGRLEDANDGQVLIIRPGDPDSIPASINPLEPEPGFPLQTHIDLVRALFLAAFEAEEPFPQVLSHALTRCYTELGWDLTLGESTILPVVPRYPTLGDLQWIGQQVVKTIGYGQEVTDNVRGFIDVRIGSLRLGTPGRFFEGGHPIDVGRLLRRNVVIELEDIGNDQDKAFLIGAVLIRLVERLRVQYGKSEEPVCLRHVTVIEEAHRLLKNVRPGSPAAHAVDLFAGLLAEIRAYGEGIIVAEQIPSKILPDVIKNTALKIVHRLPALDDRVSVGATMNLDNKQSEYVVTLKPGIAAVFADGMDRPLLVQVRPGMERESAKLAIRIAPLARIRSTACPRDCWEGQPCSLRDMAGSTRLAENPRFALWVEMIVVAHLIGAQPPSPDRVWLAGVIAEHRRRTIQCAIAQCAQAAVDVRYSELIWPLLEQPAEHREGLRYFAPEMLAAHVRDVALGQVDNLPDTCRPEEVGFQAGPYRWFDVIAALEIADQDEAAVIPLDTIKHWKERGLVLAGNRPSEQLESLRRQPACLRPKNAVIYGLRRPSRIEQTIKALSYAENWQDRLREALAFLDL